MNTVKQRLLQLISDSATMWARPDGSYYPEFNEMRRLALSLPDAVEVGEMSLAAISYDGLNGPWHEIPMGAVIDNAGVCCGGGGVGGSAYYGSAGSISPGPPPMPDTDDDEDFKELPSTAMKDWL